MAIEYYLTLNFLYTFYVPEVLFNFCQLILYNVFYWFLLIEIVILDHLSSNVIFRMRSTVYHYSKNTWSQPTKKLTSIIKSII